MLMLLLLTALLAQSDNSLGTLDAPIEAFSPKGGDEEAAATVIENIISMGLGGVTIVAGLYFILVVVVAGFNWLSAGGDTGKVGKARDSIIQGLIGIVIIVAAYTIIGIVGSVFGLSLLNPGAMLLELAPK
jgi:hypothetical protein